MRVLLYGKKTEGGGVSVSESSLFTFSLLSSILFLFHALAKQQLGFWKCGEGKREMVVLVRSFESTRFGSRGGELVKIMR